MFDYVEKMIDNDKSCSIVSISTMISVDDLTTIESSNIQLCAPIIPTEMVSLIFLSCVCHLDFDWNHDFDVVEHVPFNYNHSRT